LHTFDALRDKIAKIQLFTRLARKSYQNKL